MSTDTVEVIYPPELSAKVPCWRCGGSGERPDKPSPGTRWAMPECSSCHGSGENDRKHYAYCKRRECIGCLPTIDEIEQMPILPVWAEMLARCIPQSPDTKTHKGAVAVIRQFDGWYHSTAHFARLHTFAEQDVARLRSLIEKHGRHHYACRWFGWMQDVKGLREEYPEQPACDCWIAEALNV